MIIAPFIVNEGTFEPNRIRFEEGGRYSVAPFPPMTLGHILGSDTDGVDLLTLIVVGTKDTIFMIFLITAIRYLIAIPIGLYAYKKTGITHMIVSGWNTFFASIPTLLAAIILINMPFLFFSESRMMWVIIILALIEAGRASYIIREQAYAASVKEFSDAAKVNGTHGRRLIIEHFIPYMLPSIIMNFFIDLGRVTLLIAQLAVFSIFINQVIVLNEGVPEIQQVGHMWTSLLGSGRSQILKAFYIFFVPAFFIFYLIITFNLIGEGIKNHFLRRGEYL